MQTTTTTNKAQEIASAIIEQLGGNKFFAMTGSVCKYYDNDGAVTFKLRRNNAKAQYLKVSLNSMDTYKMDFFTVNTKTLDRTPIASYDLVYCDQLQDIFTKVTGLYTTLGTMGK